jgi:hypothetical protein
LGTIFLKPQNPKHDDEVVWEGLLRRTFAEVDPQFLPHIQRLIDHAPNMLNCMHATDCQVQIARAGHLLDVLHQAVEVSEDACEKFQEELNRTKRGQSDCRPEAYRTARLILDEAINRWEDLDEDQRLTVLALPVHRAADGRLVSLIDQEERTLLVDRLDEDKIFDDEEEEEPEESYTEVIKSRFYLQTEDGPQDTPIKLPKRRLLRSERATCAFYRQQLRIDLYDRHFVLLGCLNEIGGNDIDSQKLLAYIAKYYNDELDSLLQDGSKIAKEDAKDLQARLPTAKIVRCIDGIWRPFVECVMASSMADTLKGQGWRGQDLDALLSKLAYPESVASHDVDLILVLTDFVVIRSLLD